MPVLDQGLKNVLQGDALHVGAEVAGPDELGLDGIRRHIVGHGAFGDQHHLAGLAGQDIVVHGRRRPGEVGLGQHFRRALGMGQDLRARVGLTDFADILGGKLLVHLTPPAPGDDPHVGLAGDIAGQELVRDEDDPVHAPFAGRLFDHLHGVGAGAADVGLGLHLGGGVHVAHHHGVGILRLPRPQLIGVVGGRE